MQPNQRLPRRALGRTGLSVSVLGLGGFHLVEVEQEVVSAVVETYLGAGGNYIESAVSYGDAGASERKLARALGSRRNQVVLASKTGERDAEGAWRELHETLEHLGTDRLDVYFFHCLQREEELAQIAGPGGALESFLRAKEEGLIGCLGMTAHWPLLYLGGMERLPLDVIMTWVDYLDFCNYPEIPRHVIPAARERGLGVMGMKPFADGYLYRSPRLALEYALAQDVDLHVCGCNSVELVEADVRITMSLLRQDYLDTAKVLHIAPELGEYVCRQCDDCLVCGPNIDVRHIFELEGKFDRQMDDRLPHDAADYALRCRLGRWFNNEERAQELYGALERKAGDCASTMTDASCPYGVDVARKLRLADAKLCGNVDLV